MLRLILYLVIIYLVYRAVRYFMRSVFTLQQSGNFNRKERDVIDIDYEELKDDGEKIEKK